RRRAHRPDRDRVRTAAVPDAEPAAGAVQGPDPRPGMELRLRRPGARRRALHQLPAQEDRRGPGTAYPHRARRRVRAEAGRLATRRVGCRSMTVKSLLSRSTFPRTLRGRLITGLVSLLAIACASVGIVTYLAVQGALSRELNANLQSATGLAYNCWETQGEGGGAQSGRTQGTMPDARADSGTAADTHASNAQDSHLTADNPGPSSGTATSSDLPTCQGLGERTFVAVVSRDDWDCDLVSVGQVKLTATDKQALLSITPTPGNEVGQEAVPTTTRYLGYAHGTFELTAIQDPDGDGSIYIIGLPLNSMQDTLRDVALAEGVVFAAVLLLAGIFGFFWVRFSLRPLRRVAVTASQVAELPLEAGEVSLPAVFFDTTATTETGQVGLAFNRMLGHVETALRRRASSEARLRRFAADASHELRTPLAAIR